MSETSSPEKSFKSPFESLQFDKSRSSPYEPLNENGINESGIRTCQLVGKLMFWGGLAMAIEAIVMGTVVYYPENAYEDFNYGFNVFGAGIVLLVSSGVCFHELWVLNPRVAERDVKKEDLGVEKRDNSEVCSSIAMILVYSGFSPFMLAFRNVLMGEDGRGVKFVAGSSVIAMGVCVDFICGWYYGKKINGVHIWSMLWWERMVNFCYATFLFSFYFER